jgi:hypothetical protein
MQEYAEREADARGGASCETPPTKKNRLTQKRLEKGL